MKTQKKRLSLSIFVLLLLMMLIAITVRVIVTDYQAYGFDNWFLLILMSVLFLSSCVYAINLVYKLIKS